MSAEAIPPIGPFLLNAMKIDQPPPPSMRYAAPRPSGTSPAHEAYVEFVAAANDVLAAGDARVARDWEKRQEALAAWVVRRQVALDWPTIRAAAMSGQLVGDALVTVALRRSDWDEALTEFARLVGVGELRWVGLIEIRKQVEAARRCVEDLRANGDAPSDEVCELIRVQTRRVRGLDRDMSAAELLACYGGSAQHHTKAL